MEISDLNYLYGGVFVLVFFNYNCVVVRTVDCKSTTKPPCVFVDNMSMWTFSNLCLSTCPILPQSLDGFKKKLGWTTCFGPFSKWPPSKSGNHVLCHNLSSKAVGVTKLMSMHMFLGVRNSIMPIKNVYVLWKIYKQLFKRIFRAFSVIFCVSPWDREGYCAPSTYESPKPSLFCSLDLPQY